MTIAEVLNKYPQTAQVFMGIGMHCLGCATATQETIEEAAIVHGEDVENLLTKLNEVAQ